MSHPLRSLVVATALAFAACTAVTPREAPEARLTRLVEAHFDESLALNPMYATWIGDGRYDDQLEMTASPEYEAATMALESRYRDAVAAIAPATLDEGARLTREMFLYNRDGTLARNRHPNRALRRRRRGAAVRNDRRPRPLAVARAQVPALGGRRDRGDA
jgi:uncharacterized protein (DUF885 family)